METERWTDPRAVPSAQAQGEGPGGRRGCEGGRAREGHRGEQTVSSTVGGVGRASRSCKGLRDGDGPGEMNVWPAACELSRTIWRVHR